MNKLTLRIIGIVLLVALVALPIILLNRFGLNEETIRAYVERLGIWAPLGLFVLRFTSVVIPALPSEAYSILAGGLLGFGQGLIVVCLSDLLSCSLSFWLASTYGREGVQRLVGDRFMYRVDRFAQKHLEQNFFLMVAFLMTGFFDFVAYGIGISRAPWRKFLPALILSIAISNPPVVAIGAGILAGRGQVFLVVFAVLGVFGLALLTGWLQRRAS
ncbi:TVP38/TMEM64 family protein [Vacuolonema iberomarrocanum]|uniref:TVP38/TMEM64 family protein n=1 Tax=Vacuolonema iberomarrocanum TaxID=3454632 RepID=UPI0019EF3BBB|nr:TVP38/TMEM64 family protein [filamentous cyanobacterium LEGE 07170]